MPADLLHIVLRCGTATAPRVRYVFDTLLMPYGIETVYVSAPPSEGPWLLYAGAKTGETGLDRAATIGHCPAAWTLFERGGTVDCVRDVDGLRLPLPALTPGLDEAGDIRFDLAANAFFFLSSWSERDPGATPGSRALFSTSIFARLEIPQDIVDRYQAHLIETIARLQARMGRRVEFSPRWPDGNAYGIVLSHDVDFIPRGLGDMALQGARSVARSLVKHKDVGDTARVIGGLARAIGTRSDPYGCIPRIIAQERALGVRSSFQVAVGHRHPADVNYQIEDEDTRDYLGAIDAAGFDLCLHGSYRSAENLAWYVAEVELLTRRLRRPLGSRQHFLSFAYDALFMAQEAAGIEYDMSMGFPDRLGPRAGFSFPYFPFCVAENRPYRVLQISLFIMDVTLRGYLALRAADAGAAADTVLDELRSKGGCASVVWHPIVFGGARDPGLDRVFWKMIARVKASNGFCTDGLTVNRLWRARAASYASFQ